MTKTQFKNNKYKVLKSSDDWKDTVIEKKWPATGTFTVRKFEDNIAYMEKTLRELNAKFMHEQVVKNNIEEHHPFVLQMSEQDLYTAWMYREALEIIKQYAPRIDEFSEALQTEKDEVEHVKTLLGEELIPEVTETKDVE